MVASAANMEVLFERESVVTGVDTVEILSAKEAPRTEIAPFR
jgi:hypothetical protein